MTTAYDTTTILRHPDRLFIDGEWVQPSTSERISVRDSATEEIFLTVAEAKEADMSRAIASARNAFDDGSWPRLGHEERADYLRAIADGLRQRSSDIGQLWPRESGVVYSVAQHAAGEQARVFDYYAGLAGTFAFEAPFTPRIAPSGLVVREPVGVVGAIIPWNNPLGLIAYKIAPALLAGCTVVLKTSPEAPGEGYVIAEIVEALGLPAGVLNVVAADREVSQLLVEDARVDKISFTGSTAAGRRIASICGERIARCNLELGGKSPAIVLDDADIETAAARLAGAECRLDRAGLCLIDEGNSQPATP